MADATPSLAPPARGAAAPRRLRRRGDILGTGIVTAILAFVVLMPLSAVVWKATHSDGRSFLETVRDPEAIASLQLTLAAAAITAVVSAVTGTAVAWVLVRDRFPGRRVLDAVVDLPFALPTIVAGLTLLSLYGPESPVGIELAFTRASIVAAMLFVTFPFVVRSVQPVLIELDREMEEAAASLGATPWTIFRRIIFPNLLPAILTGTGLSFAKAIGEFGSIVLLSGNVPFDTEVTSVYTFGLIQSDEPGSAAAISTVLLAVSVVVLALLDVVRRRSVR
ncbi:MAG: sulfate transporter, inner rane subunit CysT [Thermoleophilia bacterium]|nr:sulfate transporter, inner rane subunit CysT [Thermoleophilia bacterium]